MSSETTNETYPYISLSMALVGSASMFGSTLVLLSLIVLKLYCKMPTRLVLYLCIADLIQSVATVTSFAWYNEASSQDNPVCIFQGFMLQFGDVASALAAAVVGTYVLCVISFDIKILPNPGMKFEIVSVLVIFVVSFGLALNARIQNLYGPVSYQAWCWIPEIHSTERMLFHYLWIFLICFYLFVLYLYLASSFWCAPKYSTMDSSLRKKNILKLVGFPLVFILVFLPLGVDRAIQAVPAPPRLPPEFVAFAICTFSSNGFMNAILYGSTRKIIPKIWEKFTPSSSASTTGSNLI